VKQAHTLFDSSPLPMLATEGPAHVVRYVNPAFCGLVGRLAEAIVGCQLRAPHDEDTVALLDLVFSTGVAKFGVDLARVFGNDNTIHAPCAVWPILGDNNHPVGLLVEVSAPTSDMPMRLVDSGTADALLDVNTRLLVAGLRARGQAVVEITLRGEPETALSVRDEFILMAAHELRTPVTGIKLSAQLALRGLQDGEPDTERTMQNLLSVIDGANRLTLLIDDLMDMSRTRNGELLLRLTPIDLVALVRKVGVRYAEIGGERHHVTIDVQATPLTMDGDAGRLEQILDNLLSNAIKYSPSGGEIGVRLQQTGDGIVLSVTDSGIGLTPGAQEHIFEPFGRAANASRQGLPGMGLGLYVCRQIAAAHGGRMWAESEGEGRGMTIGMWLPSA
jgi:signal transduction histidine kinase